MWIFGLTFHLLLGASVEAPFAWTEKAENERQILMLIHGSSSTKLLDSGRLGNATRSHIRYRHDTWQPKQKHLEQRFDLIDKQHQANQKSSTKVTREDCEKQLKEIIAKCSTDDDLQQEVTRVHKSTVLALVTTNYLHNHTDGIYTKTFVVDTEATSEELKSIESGSLDVAVVNNTTCQGTLLLHSLTKNLAQLVYSPNGKLFNLHATEVSRLYEVSIHD